MHQAEATEGVFLELRCALGRAAVNVLYCMGARNTRTGIDTDTAPIYVTTSACLLG